MDDFLLDEAALDVQRRAREFVKNEVSPEYLRRMDRDEIRFPRELSTFPKRRRPTSASAPC